MKVFCLRLSGLFLFLFCCLFGNAQYVFDPKYEKVQPRVSFVPGIKVVRGETRIIVPMHKNHCPSGTIFKFNNGEIQVRDMRSGDNGLTWYKASRSIGASTYQFPAPDNEAIEHSFRTKRSDKPGVYEANFFRSKDHGKTWSEFTSLIYIPAEMNWSGVTDRKIIAIDDGSLLMTLYGRIKNTANFSVIIVRSTDRGKTWNYYSTVAYSLTPVQLAEGFCEPVILKLPNKKMLCFIRTSGNYPASLGSSNNNDTSVKMPFHYTKTTPLYMSASIDNGKTWSNAEPVNSFGVWPDALVLENGIIALSYGRPGNWLMFSNNEGSTWGPNFQYYNDIYSPDCGNYVSMIEVAPNIILAVYSRSNPNDNTISEIVGTYFQVQRIGNK